MAGKKKRSKRKSRKKDHLQTAISAGIAKGMGKRGGKRKDMRPLSFLKKMKAKMEKNLPKLEALIAKGTSGGRPA
jgi:hypothetical protein